MSVEDIILARRSLVRGVVSRCLEIASQFTDAGRLVDDSARRRAQAVGIDLSKHSLNISVHRLVGVDAGFLLQTNQRSDDVALRLFFNGERVILFYVDSQTGPEGVEIWSTAVLKQESVPSAGTGAEDPPAPRGINGLAETPFWENDLEQALKDHVSLLTDYTISEGSLNADSTASSSASRVVSAIDNAVRKGDGDDVQIEFDTDGISGSGEMKNFSVQSLSDGAGQYHGFAVGIGPSEVAQRFVNKRRVVARSGDRWGGFVASLLDDAENRRNKVYRDVDGNPQLSLGTFNREDVGDGFDYSDLLEVLYTRKKEVVTMTASEVVNAACDVHSENRRNHLEEQERQQSARAAADLAAERGRSGSSRGDAGNADSDVDSGSNVGSDGANGRGKRDPESRR